MQYFSRSGITAFTDALAHALYDTAIERDRPMLFVCDSDVVYRMIFKHVAPRDSVNERDELVEALLSAGFLGKVSLLRPHAIELHASIRREAERGDSGANGDYRRKIEAFSSSRNVRSAIDELLDAINEEQLQASTAKFLAVLRRSGATTFVAVELAHGVWQERLRRLNGTVLDLSGVGDSMRSLLEDPDTWRLFHQVGQRRPDRDVPVNNLTDAAALVALKSLVATQRNRSARAGRAILHDHPIVLSLLRDNTATDIRKALPYDVRDEWRLERSRGAGFRWKNFSFRRRPAAEVL